MKMPKRLRVVRPRLQRVVRPESRKLLILRRNSWRFRNPSGGFMPTRFMDPPPGFKRMGKRLLRTRAPLEIGRVEDVRFIVSDPIEDGGRS